jgi:hypothetical protein
VRLASAALCICAPMWDVFVMVKLPGCIWTCCRALLI